MQLLVFVNVLSVMLLHGAHGENATPPHLVHCAQFCSMLTITIRV